jgi:hypothetical protein
MIRRRRQRETLTIPSVERSLQQLAPFWGLQAAKPIRRSITWRTLGMRNR